MQKCMNENCNQDFSNQVFYTFIFIYFIKTMELYNYKNCKYCNKIVDINYAQSIICNKCKNNVHLTCLKRQSTPGGILGDIFFDYTCQECSETYIEIFERKKMTWFQVIVLVLYHLQHRISGTSNNGYFHWKVHLVTFIDKKWTILLGKEMKKKKNWMGTVSGSLSHFSPCFFTSGGKLLGSAGWWKLTFPSLTPGFVSILYAELTADKKVNLKNENDLIIIEKFIHSYEKCNSEKLLNANEYIKPINKYNNDFFISNMDLDMNFDMNMDIDIENNYDFNLEIDEKTTLKHCLIDINQTCEEHLKNTESLIEKPKKCIKKEKSPKFSKKLVTNFYENWKESQQNIKQDENIVRPLRIVEESVLYKYVSKMTVNDRRTNAIKRKLQIRSIKRNKNKKILNVDEVQRQAIAVPSDLRYRFSHYFNAEQLRQSRSSYYLERRIVPIQTKYKGFAVSPYTDRLLKPYILRDTKHSLWLQLMHELLYTVHSKKCEWIEPPISTIDYCYVRAEFIPAINSICEKYFWPGIDMTESLEYPDFSCVVLYKQLVIGFAFMVPDVKFNETYISFVFTRPEWRNCGIGKFMIYHLIQTCMGKDITLHVAMDNPALFLYQKFGFKVEEIIYNFYDAYLRDDSNQCKHAFFLRLER